MSVKVMTSVWQMGPDDPVDRYVLVKLADNANDQGESCFPSLPEICKATRLSESSVRRAINSLELSGFISVRRGIGKGNKSQYKLHVDKWSQGNLSQGKVSERKLSDRPSKGVTVTDKGVTVTNPPHPLIGVTTKNHQEPPKEEKELFSLEVVSPRGKAFANSDKEALVEQCFLLYRRLFNLSATDYRLTTSRKSRALSRLDERLAVHNGDLFKAGQDLARAIHNLAANDWNVRESVVDWNGQIFKSRDQFETRLNWKKGPSNGSNANRSQARADSNDDARRRALLEIGCDPGFGLAGGVSTGWSEHQNVQALFGGPDDLAGIQGSDAS